MTDPHPDDPMRQFGPEDFPGIDPDQTTMLTPAQRRLAVERSAAAAGAAPTGRHSAENVPAGDDATQLLGALPAPGRSADGPTGSTGDDGATALLSGGPAAASQAAHAAADGATELLSGVAADGATARISPQPADESPTVIAAGGLGPGGDGPTDVIGRYGHAPAQPVAAPPPTLMAPAAPAGGLDAMLSAPEPPPEDSADAPPKRKKKRPGWLIPAIVAAALILLLAGAYVVDLIRTNGQIEAGTVIGGVDVGGLTPEEAKAALTAETESLRQPFAVTAHGEELTLDPHEAGLAFDIDESVDAAGLRSASPVARVSALFGNERELPVIATVDDTLLTEQVQGLATATNVAAVEAVVELAGTDLTVTDPVIGLKLDVPGSVEQLKAAWLSGTPSAVAGLDLPVTSEPVRATPEKTRAAAAEIETLLAGPLAVQAGDTSFEISADTIAAAVSVSPDDADGFEVTLDDEAIVAGAMDKLKAVEADPSDASLALVDGAPKITKSVDGMVLDEAATTAAVDAALRDPARELTAVYEVTEPDLTTAEVEAWGIKEPISEFTTGGFAWDSGQNVKRAAEEVNGAIVLPGETFSLNGHTGPRTAAEGYIAAGIIQDGVPSRAVGGGISQFATTLFNALYFAGMEDVEHKAHSFYISRYPEGREATVFQNPDGSSVIDVKFKNTSDTAVLIETIWTDYDITVRFWGTKTVEVESVTGERYNYTSAPTKTIPYGQPCSPSGGSSGFSVNNTRIVRDLDGNELWRENTTTVYNGQQATICEPPPPEPDPPAPSEPESPPASNEETPADPAG